MGSKHSSEPTYSISGETAPESEWRRLRELMNEMRLNIQVLSAMNSVVSNQSGADFVLRESVAILSKLQKRTTNEVTVV